MTKVAVLVVLYEIDPNDSSSLNCLGDQKYEKFKLFIWDNSRKPFPLVELKALKKKFTNISYSNTPQNLGLSVIYNKVLAECADSYDLLMIFDQDSYFAKDYIDTIVHDYQKKNSCAVYVPLVFSRLKYHSPRPDMPLIRRFWRSSGGRSYSAIARLNSINSGNALNISILRKIKFAFDEGLSFYGVDNFLFRTLYKMGLGIFVSNACLNQSLFTQDPPSNDALFKRYEQVMEAYKKVYFPQGLNLWKLFAIFHILGLAVSRRDMKFFLLVRYL